VPIVNYFVVFLGASDFATHRNICLSPVDSERHLHRVQSFMFGSAHILPSNQGTGSRSGSNGDIR
jgi:hypothetical protein